MEAQGVRSLGDWGRIPARSVNMGLYYKRDKCTWTKLCLSASVQIMIVFSEYYERIGRPRGVG